MTNVTLSLFAGAGAQFLDNSGNVLTGGLIYTYSAGTTTPLATYTSNLGTTAHTNPIILDASGRIAAGEIWLTTGFGYKFVLKDANNVLIGTYDNIPSSAQPPIINDASSIAYEQGYTVTAGSFIVGITYLITSVGTTNFQAIGAVSNTVGVLFTATGVGSGTGTAQLSRTVQNKLQESVSVKDFGAVGNGSTDDTTAIQAAITSCQSSGRDLLLNAGSYLISSSLTISSQISIYGEGIASKLIVKSTVGSTIDAIKIVPTATIVGINLSNFAIQAQSGTPGRHAISVDITTYPVSYCTFTNLWLFQLGGRGFAVIPNATPLVDGFFTSTISDSIIYGGIYLDKAGDSLRIERNTLTGNNVGIYVDLVYGAFDQGAHGLLIDSNNITSNGGSLYLLNGTSGVFSNNNCELPTPSGVVNSAMVNIAGTVGSIVNSFVIINNYIGSAVATYSPLRFDYTRNCLSIGNYVARPLNTPSYVITANSTGARFLQNCDAIDEVYTNSSTGLFYDNGVATSLIRSFSDNLQFTNNLQFVKTNKTINWVDSANNNISCLGLSAIDNFFYVGATTATATSAGLVFLTNGAEVGRFNPSGGFRTKVYTYATLPASPTQGTVAFVSDATVATFYSAVAGGGSIAVPVFFDGTVWRIG